MDGAYVVDSEFCLYRLKVEEPNLPRARSMRRWRVQSFQQEWRSRRQSPTMRITATKTLGTIPVSCLLVTLERSRKGICAALACYGQPPCRCSGICWQRTRSIVLRWLNSQRFVVLTPDRQPPLSPSVLTDRGAWRRRRFGLAGHRTGACCCFSTCMRDAGRDACCARYLCS